MAISNANETKRILGENELFAKKRFGQNFIIDPSVVIKIAENANTDNETIVLEIGPGLGALSEQLALRSKKVIAFEIDRDLTKILSTTMAHYPFEVIEGDFLEADLSPYQGIEKLVVCGNVPYNITSPILFKLIEADLNMSQITLMVQKEVAERLNAKVNTKEYNALSIMMTYLFETKIISTVPKQCFYPVPKVDSMVIALIPKNQPLVDDQDAFFKFLRGCFAMRRKTILNNLKAMDYDALSALEKVNISSSARPESLTLNDFVALYGALREN